MRVLNRIWTGIVGALVGSVFAVLLQIVGQMVIGLSLDCLKWILAACATGGFLVGTLIGPKNVKPNQ